MIAILILVILTILSGMCSAAETSLFSLSPMTLRSFNQSDKPRKRLIANLLKSPYDLLVTVLMLNVLVNILIQNTSSHIFGTLSSWLLTVGVPLGLTLILGEIIPKTLAMQNNKAYALFIAPPVAVARTILGPIRSIITLFASILVRSIFFFLKKEKRITKEELKYALKTGLDQGILNPREAILIQGYLYLRYKSVAELKRPRNEIIYYDLSEPLSHLEQLLVEQEVSRLPICDGGLENIKGIISIKSYILHKHLFSKSRDILPYVAKPYFVPESMPAKSLLRYLDNKNKSMAIVVDEYGAITGLITQEDLIEAVVGEISDRRDMKIRYSLAGKDAIVASGKLELTEFEEIFGTYLSSAGNMVTINGWLIEKLGNLPPAGTKLEEEGFFFHVLSADPSRIRRVYIRKLKKSKK